MKNLTKYFSKFWIVHVATELQFSFLSSFLRMKKFRHDTTNGGVQYKHKYLLTLHSIFLLPETDDVASITEVILTFKYQDKGSEHESMKWPLSLPYFTIPKKPINLPHIYSRRQSLDWFLFWQWFAKKTDNLCIFKIGLTEIYLSSSVH